MVETSYQKGCSNLCCLGSLLLFFYLGYLHSLSEYANYFRFVGFDQYGNGAGGVCNRSSRNLFCLWHTNLLSTCLGKTYLQTRRVLFGEIFQAGGMGSNQLHEFYDYNPLFRKATQIQVLITAWSTESHCGYHELWICSFRSSYCRISFVLLLPEIWCALLVHVCSLFNPRLIIVVLSILYVKELRLRWWRLYNMITKSRIV